jgi:hypothetical protein
MKLAGTTLVDLLFGCWHRHLSFPRSVSRGERRFPAASETGTYVVCLDCGKEFAYDWEEMRLLGPGEHTSHSRAPLGIESNKAA